MHGVTTAPRRFNNSQERQCKQNLYCAGGGPGYRKLLLVCLLVTHFGNASVHAWGTITKTITGSQQRWIYSRDGTAKREALSLPSLSSSLSLSRRNIRSVHCATSRSPLFSTNNGHMSSDNNGNNNTPSNKPRSARQNLAVLARVSISGMLAFFYMNYFALAALGASGYYVFQKLVCINTWVCTRRVQS